MAITKLYCYVDENGQETNGRIFVVSVVVTQQERDSVSQICEQLEQISGKQKDKWGAAKHDRRMRYLRFIFADDRLKNCLRYAVSRGVSDFDTATIAATAEAIKWQSLTEKFTTVIYVDGLTKTKRQEYGARLRRQGIPVRKIMGVARDETSPLTRLADAIAGFVRDALDDRSEEIKHLFQKARKDGMLIEV